MIKKNAKIVFKGVCLLTLIGLFFYATPVFAQTDYVNKVLSGMGTSVKGWKDNVQTLCIAIAIIGVIAIAGIGIFQFFANNKPPMQILQENLGKIIAIAVLVTVALISATALG